MLVFCGAGVPSCTSFGEANHNKQFAGTKFDVVLDQRQNINVSCLLTSHAVNLFSFSFFTHTQITKKADFNRTTPNMHIFKAHPISQAMD